MNNQSPRIDGYRAHVSYETEGAWLGMPVPLSLHTLSRAYSPALLPSA